MLIDGVQLAEGSDFANATIDSGTTFPSQPDEGELYFRSDLDTLHYYNGTTWLEISTGAVDLSKSTGVLTVAHGGTGVTSATGTGSLVLNTAPAFSGFPTSTTPSTNDSSTVIATTAFVKAVTAGLAASSSLNGYAPLASPAFTGTPTSTTPATSDSSTAVATTAYVKAVVAAIPTAPTAPYDIAGSILSKPTASAFVTRFVANRAFTIPNGYTNSIARVATTATASYVLTIQKNGASIGTITFAAGGTNGTFAGAGGTFASGDVMTVVAPGTADATFNDATFTIAATLS